MFDKKIHYKCQSCEKPYWVSPLAGGDQDVIVEHPCSKCGTRIELCFKGVAGLSLMMEDKATANETVDTKEKK